MLSVHRLRVLREVVSQGSFSRAAEALSYTQSAVSQAIARLEAETGTPLVERHRRGLRATPAGEVLVAHADTILARLDPAEAELPSVIGVSGGRRRPGSLPPAGATVVAVAGSAVK